MSSTSIRLAAAVAATMAVSAVFATVVPFTENFAADAANWREGTGVTDATWNASGGPDGSSYVSSTGSFANNNPGDTPIFLRGHDTFNSSGGAFVGDWLADGVTAFSVYVRHDAPLPLTYFVRFAKPANFPAAVGVEFVPVLPNTWTRIDLAIFEGNPEFVNFETSDFQTIFSGIGKLQIGVMVPDQLAGSPQTFTFGFDQIAIVPEPSAAAAVSLLALAALRRRGAIRLSADSPQEVGP